MGASSTRPRREVIRPDYDPVVITLDKDPDQCVQREGQYGIDYQFIVNGDTGIMWLPKAGRDALVQSGARAGDQVEICKSQRGRMRPNCSRRNRAMINWRRGSVQNFV